MTTWQLPSSPEGIGSNDQIHYHLNLPLLLTTFHCILLDFKVMLWNFFIWEVTVFRVSCQRDQKDGKEKKQHFQPHSSCLGDTKMKRMMGSIYCFKGFMKMKNRSYEDQKPWRKDKQKDCARKIFLRLDGQPEIFLTAYYSEQKTYITIIIPMCYKVMRQYCIRL